MGILVKLKAHVVAVLTHFKQSPPLHQGGAGQHGDGHGGQLCSWRWPRLASPHGRALAPTGGALRAFRCYTILLFTGDFIDLMVLTLFSCV